MPKFFLKLTVRPFVKDFAKDLYRILYKNFASSVKDLQLFKNSFISPVLNLKNCDVTYKKCDATYMESFKQTFWVFCAKKTNSVDFSLLI